MGACQTQKPQYRKGTPRSTLNTRLQWGKTNALLALLEGRSHSCEPPPPFRPYHCRWHYPYRMNISTSVHKLDTPLKRCSRLSYPLTSGVVQTPPLSFIFEEGRAGSWVDSAFGSPFDPLLDSPFGSRFGSPLGFRFRQRKGRRGWVFLAVESLKGGDRKERKISLCVPISSTPGPCPQASRPRACTLSIRYSA